MIKSSLRRVVAAAGCLVFSFGTLSSAQTVSSSQFGSWDQAGMEFAWDFQVPTDPALSGSVHVTSYVSAKKKRTIHEVSYQGGPTTVFAAGQVDRRGTRLDAAGAAFQADVELRTLKALGHDDATVEVREVPEVSLLIQTGSGQLLLLDGETGELRWSLVIGKQNLTNQRPALGEDYVVAINGSSLYIINVETGKLEVERRLHGIPDAAPTIAGDRAIVPIMGRPFEVYSLAEGELNKMPMLRISFGRITDRPVATPISITWATDRGYLFMADPDSGIATARVEARKGIVGAPTFVPPDWVVIAVEDGYVLAVELQRQVIQWEFFTGHSLSEAPYALGDAVYVPTTQNELFKLSASEGKLQWTTSGVRRVVSGLGDRLFCEGTRGEFVTIDTNDGRHLGQTPLSRHDHMLSNPLTDRIYVVRNSGLIECVRAKGARWPTLHLPLPEVAEAAGPAAGEAESTDGEPDSLGDPNASDDISEEDPFADGEDASRDSMDDANPFEDSGDEDPFAASGDDEDPFASDAAEDNPFEDAGADEAGSDEGGGDEEDPFATDADEEDPFAESGDDPFANLGEDPFG